MQLELLWCCCIEGIHLSQWSALQNVCKIKCFYIDLKFDLKFINRGCKQIPQRVNFITESKNYNLWQFCSDMNQRPVCKKVYISAASILLGQESNPYTCSRILTSHSKAELAKPATDLRCMSETSCSPVAKFFSPIHITLEYLRGLLWKIAVYSIFFYYHDILQLLVPSLPKRLTSSLWN